MSSGNVAKAKDLHARGYTWAEIAEILGVSVTTVQKAVDGEEGA